MPLATMAALMLLVALISGLIDETLNRLKLKGTSLALFLFALVLLRRFEIRISSEIAFTPAVPLLLYCVLIRCGSIDKAGTRRGLLLSVPIALALRPALELADADAAVLACCFIFALATGILPSARSLSARIVSAAFAPMVCVLIGLGEGLASIGYGLFEPDAAVLDLELMLVLTAVFITELRAFNGKIKAMDAYAGPAHNKTEAGRY